MISISRLARSIKPVYRSDMDFMPMGWDSAHVSWFGGPRRLDVPGFLPPPGPPTFLVDERYAVRRIRPSPQVLSQRAGIFLLSRYGY